MLRTARSTFRSLRKPAFEKLEDRTLLANVAVDLSEGYQTMQSIGGSYPMALYSDVGQNAQGKWTLDNLAPQYNRTVIPINFWEPSNDNSDSNSINNSGFKDEGKVHDVFLLMKEMEQRGMKIVASVWDGPSWMVDNTSARDKHTIPQSKEAEMIESIAAFVKRAKDSYGVTIEYLSFNESNGGYKLLISPEQTNRLVKGVQERLASMGITYTKWIAGETFAVWDSIDYIRDTLKNPETRQYYAAVSYHSWWSESVAKQDWEALYNLANQYGLPLWCGEVGYHGNEEGWQPPASWDNTERTLKTYHQIIGWSHATTTFHWTYQDNLTVVSPDLKPYSLYYAMKQLGDIWTEGTTVVDTTSDSSSIWALAGKNVEDNRFVAEILNTSSSSNSVTLTGLPNKPLTLVRTRGDSNSVIEGAKTIGTYTPENGTLTLNIAGDSFNTLVGELGVSTPPVETDTPPTIGSLDISPNPVTIGTPVTLTANNVEDPDGPIETVLFYRESNGSAGLQTGTNGDTLLGGDAQEAGGYTLSTPTTGLSGTVTYYAQATDRKTSERGNVVSGTLTFQTSGGTAEVTLEAESATVAGGAVKSSKNSGYVGTGYADFGTSSGQYVEWTTTNAEAGSRTLTFRYAHTGAARTMNLTINGVAAGTVTFTETGGLSVWKTVDKAVTLPAGTVKIRLTTGSTGGPNIDNVKIAGGPPPPTNPEEPTEPQPPVDNATYQAEAAALVAGADRKSGESGWTGTGYVDYSAATGGYIEWNNLYSGGSADRVIQFRFSNGSGSARKLAVTVNGVAIGQVNFAATGGWAKWQTVNFTVPVNSGLNIIRVTTIGQNGPNIDSLALLPGLAPPPPPPPVTYQVESFTVAGGAVKSTKNSGYTGSGYADFGAKSGQYIELTINVTTAGERTLQFRYAHDTTARTMNLTINGVAAGTVTFSNTGGLKTWKTVDKTLTLPTGPVVLRLTTGSAGGPNIDSVTLI